jgi:hypothetical protein
MEQTRDQVMEQTQDQLGDQVMDPAAQQDRIQEQLQSGGNGNPE